jgi:hypothetical protein
MIESGTKDLNGNFIPESDTAILRNHLSPFWTLVDLCELEKNPDKDITELLERLIQTCKKSQVKVIQCIERLEQDTITGYRMDKSGKVWSYDEFKYATMNKYYTKLPLTEEDYVNIFSHLEPIEIKRIK